MGAQGSKPQGQPADGDVASPAANTTAPALTTAPAKTAVGTTAAAGTRPDESQLATAPAVGTTAAAGTRPHESQIGASTATPADVPHSAPASGGAAGGNSSEIQSHPVIEHHEHHEHHEDAEHSSQVDHFHDAPEEMVGGVHDEEGNVDDEVAAAADSSALKEEAVPHHATSNGITTDAAPVRAAPRLPGSEDEISADAPHVAAAHPPTAPAAPGAAAPTAKAADDKVSGGFGCFPCFTPSSKKSKDKEGVKAAPPTAEPQEAEPVKAAASSVPTGAMVGAGAGAAGVGATAAAVAAHESGAHDKDAEPLAARDGTHGQPEKDAEPLAARDVEYEEPEADVAKAAEHESPVLHAKGAEPHAEGSAWTPTQVPDGAVEAAAARTPVIVTDNPTFEEGTPAGVAAHSEPPVASLGGAAAGPVPEAASKEAAVPVAAHPPSRIPKPAPLIAKEEHAVEEPIKDMEPIKESEPIEDMAPIKKSEPVKEVEPVKEAEQVDNREPMEGARGFEHAKPLEEGSAVVPPAVAVVFERGGAEKPVEYEEPLEAAKASPGAHEEALEAEDAEVGHPGHAEKPILEQNPVYEEHEGETEHGAATGGPHAERDAHHSGEGGATLDPISQDWALVEALPETPHGAAAGEHGALPTAAATEEPLQGEKGALVGVPLATEGAEEEAPEETKAPKKRGGIFSCFFPQPKEPSTAASAPAAAPQDAPVSAIPTDQAASAGAGGMSTGAAVATGAAAGGAAAGMFAIPFVSKRRMKPTAEEAKPDTEEARPAGDVRPDSFTSQKSLRSQRSMESGISKRSDSRALGAVAKPTKRTKSGPVDYSAMVLEKQKSRKLKDGYNTATGLYDAPQASLVAPGVYSPMRTMQPQLERTLSGTRRPPIDRTPIKEQRSKRKVPAGSSGNSGKARAPAEKGTPPRAPAEKGTPPKAPSAARSSNEFRPMSSSPAAAAPQAPKSQYRPMSSRML